MARNVLVHVACDQLMNFDYLPRMENKCGDRLAAPSVYGRTQDVVGNSIPGFATSYKMDLKNIAGGFPNY
jgi:hypothetical protein